MAISSLVFICRSHFPIRPPPLYCLTKFRFISASAAVAIETIHEPDASAKDATHNRGSDGTKGNGDKAEWKKFNSKDLGISTSKITKPTRQVLNSLKRKGYEVYLVGGCVRDLILKRTPKDFDVLTSAELVEVAQTFPRCKIVGRKFPICHVHIGDDIVEVSSFSTSNKSPSHTKMIADFQKSSLSEDRDSVRFNNCLQRDFTINGLMFDPYAKVVYDYLGGIEDIRNAKVRTVFHAGVSFQEDCVRILRGIRITARLRFKICKETAHYVKNLSFLVQRLDRRGIMMEMNYMLAYGSAEASLRLLWKFGLLEFLLPIQAAYFVRSGFKRRDKRSNMLLSLFSNLDKLLAPDRPCNSILWIAILAFHKALEDQPRDPLVVAAFTLAVHNGGDLMEAVKITRNITRPHNRSLPELLEPQNLDYETLIEEVMDIDESVKEALSHMTDKRFVSKAMAAYPEAPYSEMMFIPQNVYLGSCGIFECVKNGREEGFVPKEGSKVDHKLLSLGNFSEVRHVFARVVFDTVFPLNLKPSTIVTHNGG